ncbi:DNA methyltransferase [Candidatus Harpocratesius sp.]
MNSPKYTFIAGDGSKQENFPTNNVDLVLFDPPFKPKITKYKQIRKQNKNQLEPIETPMGEKWEKFLSNLFFRLKKHDISTKSTYFIIKFDDYSAREFYKSQNVLEWSYSIIWDKCRIGLGRKFRKQHELIEVYVNNKAQKLYWWQKTKESAKRKWHGESQGIAFPSIISIPNYNSGTKGVRKICHINQTPWELWVPFIEHCCPPGGLIYDPAMGTGSIAKAVYFLNQEKKLNISYHGVDIEQDYVDFARRNYRIFSKPCKELFRYYETPYNQTTQTILNELIYVR